MPIKAVYKSPPPPSTFKIQEGDGLEDEKVLLEMLEIFVKSWRILVYLLVH